MSGKPTPSHQAAEIKLHRRSRRLDIRWSDGTNHELPCELLRVYSPSAEVRGHGAGDRILQTGKKYVGIAKIEPVGNYALRLTFDDGHDTGLFSFEFLRDLGDHQARYWREYEVELQKANASRLPAISVANVAHWQPDRT